MACSRSAGTSRATGGACDGFAFVRLTADPFATLVSQIAAGLALISLITLITIAMRRTRVAEVVPEGADRGDGRRLHRRSRFRRQGLRTAATPKSTLHPKEACRAEPSPVTMTPAWTGPTP